ncbi:diaminopimelate epimerase [Robertmurraya korlensis]|uniref:diaminopimelate epimerase n=1 Tax=Robertmurraya korlensis TaxID=519977 RepID=UPI00082580B3|nr:diaminopimelate epimerase [Robertmurraya korlensis]
MVIELLKCHGSNNDFLIIDEMENPLFTEEQRSELALLLCNREKGIGADGILFVLNSDHSDAKMRVFNADGSEASMCGNGLRCVARYVCEKLSIQSAIIETMKANLEVKERESILDEIPTYQVEISPVSFELKDLPLHLDQKTLINEKIQGLSEISYTAVAVPNPHLIGIVTKEQIQSNIQKDISEKVNNPNELFPDGVNVSFVKPLSEGSIFVRTFERGVGFTNACGTAMSASTLVTCLLGINEFEQPVEVYNPGGKVRCVAHKVDESYKIDLIGNATFTHRLQVEIQLEQQIFSYVKKEEITKEISQYKSLEEHSKQVLNEWL